MTERDEITEELRYQVDGHVAVLTFNRPERMNTISPTMLDLLCDRLLQADRDRNIRCIVLTGEGRAFCAGLDVKAQASGDGMLQESAMSVPELDLRHTPPTVLHDLDTPVIAALNGGAAGYGLDIALGCDIRIAAQSAKLAVAFAKRGVLPESGGTWLLPRLVGWSKAAELIFTGRTLSAPESLALGLANEIVPDAELQSRARAVAAEIAANAPLAVQSAKRLMRMGMEETFNDHVHHVYLQFLQLIRTGDFKEGMTSFLEKRPADFQGR